MIKDGNGDTRDGEVTGDRRVTAANGDVVVDRAGASVVVKTANGSVRVGEVVRGSVVLETALGELEVGIRQGNAAWLDASSGCGRVRTSLDAADSPEPADSTVEVRARTSFGDVLIHRSGQRTNETFFPDDSTRQLPDSFGPNYSSARTRAFEAVAFPSTRRVPCEAA